MNYQTTTSQGNESNPTTPINNGTIPGENSTTTTPQPSITPTPSQTNHPVISTTPAPTSLLPDDCRINYQETSRSYDKDTNTTQIALYLEVIPDFSTRRTFVLYPQNFYLKENDKTISIMNTNETGDGILLNENYRQTADITIQVAGNYTSKNYELAYNNFPAILVNWKKLT